jgi:hypothetical protein
MYVLICLIWELDSEVLVKVLILVFYQSYNDFLQANVLYW